jgi:acylphosphatase
MAIRRVRIVVHGVVQGVAYRASTWRQAQALGVVGWVRNLPDGTVELEAQGARVDELEAWCRHGPPLADVTKLDVEDVPAVDAERGFEII